MHNTADAAAQMHRLRYRLFSLLLDLDEIDTLARRLRLSTD